MAKKKMTIEDLAAITQKGFAQVDNRFAKVEVDIAFLKSDARERKRENAELKKTLNQLIGKIDEFITIIKKHDQEILFFKRAS